jgi:hypothetical protein
MGHPQLQVLWAQGGLSPEFNNSYFSSQLVNWLSSDIVSTTSENFDWFCTYCGASV